jgi:hypothetical protein
VATQPSINTESNVYTPLPTSVAVTPYEVTLQPIAAQSKISAVVVAVSVTVSLPPPQAVRLSKRPAVNQVCFVNKFIGHSFALLLVDWVGQLD